MGQSLEKLAHGRTTLTIVSGNFHLKYLTYSELMRITKEKYGDVLFHLLLPLSAIREQEKIHPPRREKTGAEAPPLWLDLLHALVWSVVLVALCFTFFVRIICVEGISMEPALRQNDRVLVLSTLWHAPQNGDIVVFRKDSFLSEAVRCR